MATEVFQFTGVAGTTHYLAIFNSSGQVLDFADNTFKALSGATTPRVTATERTDMGGAKSGFTASVDLANVNSTSTVTKYFADWYTDTGLTTCVSNTIEFAVASSALVVLGQNVSTVIGAVGSVTGAVGSVTGAVGSVTGNVDGNVSGNVTGNVGGNVTGSVGSVAIGGIAAASFASGAITAAAIATDALGALELGADAATEIATAVRSEMDTSSTKLAAILEDTGTTLPATEWSVNVTKMVGSVNAAEHLSNSAAILAALNYYRIRGSVQTDAANTTTSFRVRTSHAGVFTDFPFSALIGKELAFFGDSSEVMGERSKCTNAVAHATAGNIVVTVSPALSAVPTANTEFAVDHVYPAIAGDAMTLTSGERDAVAAALLDLADGVEASITVRKSLRAIAVVLAGTTSGGGTGTEVFKSIGGSTTRVTSTVENDGDRTAVTLSLT